MIELQHDQYTILRKLGEGGMGVVYLAEDKMLERQVAIKALHKQLAQGPDSLGSRFQQEALALARLNHPNITHLYAFIPYQGTYLMVMEYVEGRTLEDCLKEKGQLSSSLAGSIIIQLLQGLEHAHRKGIIHRDLKPANIMISKDGEIKIMDFGIARIRNSQRMTQHGKSVGTLEYMSPEQIQGKEGDEMTDIYASGNILYELLSGQTPFKSDTDYHLMKAKLEEKPPLLAGIMAAPQALKQVVFKALERIPEKRYGSVSSMRIAIEQSLGGNIIKEGQLIDALQGNNLPTAMQAAKPRNNSNSLIGAALKNIKAAMPGRIHSGSIADMLTTWDTSKSVKLLIAVVVLCSALLIWNYFRSPDDSAITEPGAKKGGEPEYKVNIKEDKSLPADTTDFQAQTTEGEKNNETKEKPAEIETVVPKEQKLVSKKEVKPKKQSEKPTESKKQTDTPVTPPPVTEPVISNSRSTPPAPIKVPAGRKISVMLDENLSSENTSRDGGAVKMHCTEDVIVNGYTIIKNGATVTGKIVDVVPSGGRKKALIGFVIQRILAADGSYLKLESERIRLQSSSSDAAIFRQGTVFSAALGRGTVY